MNRLVSGFCRIVLKPLIDWCLIKEVRGLENIPKSNFILAANHQSHLDQICTGYLCVPRRFHMLGQTDQYRGLPKLLLHLTYFLAGVIPVNRKNKESRSRAFQEAVKALKMGDIVILYPEGTRTRTGQFQRAYSGVAKLHLATGAPILPVAIDGTFELMPPGRAFPRVRKILKITVGAPLYFRKEIEGTKLLDCQSPEYKTISQKIADKVMERIKELK